MTMGLGNLVRLAGAALVFAILAAPNAAAGQRPLGVLELFTSQGCSSCPPADALLGELAREGKVVALAYHVDYWNYLGWQDTLSSPLATERQNSYMRSFGKRSVYTPQAVINGRVHVNGARRMEVNSALGAMVDTSGSGLSVDVNVKPVEGKIVIETGAADKPAGEAHVLLVYYEPAKAVEISRGENAGKTITYWNAVKEIHTAGLWHGEKARFELPISESARAGGGCAVLVQAAGKDGALGPILGAAATKVAPF
jgi:hypothetical protein